MPKSIPVWPGADTMRVINTYYEPVEPEHKLTEEQIIALCCSKVPVNDCAEVGLVSDYEGADKDHRNSDEDEALAQARADYPKARILSVKTEGLGPPPGTPCGKKYESWQDHNNCCDGVPDLAWDDDATPDVLPHGGSIIIAWTGGTGGEVTVTTSSNGTHFADGRKSITGHGYAVELQAGATFCGATSVTVRDGCSNATIEIRSDLGQWVSIGPVCVLPGATAHEAFGNLEIRQKISGRFKQIEGLTRYYWCYGGLKCPVENGDPPATCIPDCAGSVCAALETIRGSAGMNTCMSMSPAAGLLGVTSFCTMADGSSAVIHPVYSTAYSCDGTAGYGSGTTSLICGLFFITGSLTAYQWMC
ncbi:MAG: hypothetical protein ACOYB1_18410 [Limnohabitans sp.]